MTTMAHSAGGFSIPSVKTIGRLALGGLIGLLVWEVWARVLTNAILGYPLEPAGLIDAIAQHQLGLSVPYLLREVLHYGVGILGYPIAYYVISRMVPRWGLVLDIITLVYFSIAVAVFASTGKASPLFFIFWTVVAGLVATRLINKNALIADAISWGNFTWVNALAIMAPIGGLSVFLLSEGGELSYMSFVGHVIYGAIAVYVFERLDRE
jgi:hypothetical protein